MLRGQRRTGRIAATAVVVATLVATVAIAATVQRDVLASPQAHAFASGAFSMSNSRDGEAVFHASNLAPGDAATGTVTIRNTGTVAGSLDLSPALVETSGPRGQALIDALELRVADVTDGSATEVYGGELGALPTLALATLVPDAARTYRFTAILPDTGPSQDGFGDNFLQRASVSVAYDWTLTQTTEPPIEEPPPTVEPPNDAPRGTDPPAIEPPAGDPAPAAPDWACGKLLVGTPKSNRLTGTSGGDRIYGKGGRDRIRGGRGEDCISSGAGGDRIAGGAGADRLHGGAGSDTLSGGGGRDRIMSGSGSDRIHTRDGKHDSIDCGRGQDSAWVDRGDRVRRGCERVRRPGQR